MHSFICSNPPNLPESLDTLHIHPDPSIGIEAVRTIQTFLSKRPSQLDYSSVIIHDAHLATLPAQQALLKTLEEPPEYAQIYLVTSHPDLLLSTTLSRIQIINPPHHPNLPDHPDNPDISHFFSIGVGDRLKLLDSLALTRDTALDFLDQLEGYLHNQIQSGTYNLQPTTYNLISETRKFLKANCNLKLTLDRLALHIDK